MLNVHHIRIYTIQNAPFSWKEKDTLTAAEKYMNGAIEMPFVEMCKVCFPDVSQEEFERIECIWQYAVAAVHLNKSAAVESEDKDTSALKIKAAKIYELEYQRLLGGLFSLDHNFWRAFYKRQEIESDKILIALDALQFISNSQNALAYQWLIQVFREILKGQYAKGRNRSNHFKYAKRLLVDLPVTKLQSWLDLHLDQT